jgi:hypothetical protein
MLGADVADCARDQPFNILLAESLDLVLSNDQHDSAPRPATDAVFISTRVPGRPR